MYAISKEWFIFIYKSVNMHTCPLDRSK